MVDLAGVGGRHLEAGTLGGAFLVSLADGSARELPDVSPPAQMGQPVALGADGRFAAAGRFAPLEHRGVRVWDLESLEMRALEGSDVHSISLAFAPDGTLLSSGEAGIFRWDLDDGSRTTLVDVRDDAAFALSPDGRHLLVATGRVTGTAADRSVVSLHDLAAGTSRPFTSLGDRLASAAFGPTGQWIVTGDADGVVRAGSAVAISPDGRWVASSEAGEPTVRLLPEGPPLQTLPHDELMARLRAMTNMRVVRSDDSTSGYQLDYDPYPGWAGLAERTAP